MKKLLMSLAAVAVLTGCQSTPSTDNGEAAVKVEILVQGEAVADKAKTIKVEAGEDVLDAIKDNYEVVENNGLITAIAGIESDKGDNKGRYWKLVVNGEMSMVGAKDVKLKEGDTVTFDLTDDWN
ncbi:DUF4430 domain-containing protein [Aerococcaceae bacterium NML180378]|nr:DUF4430 domain-containing protein [Aerococcaceae bacterium NML180378]